MDAFRRPEARRPATNSAMDHVMTRAQANLLLLFAGAIWGMGFVAQTTAMASIGPMLFIGLRFVAATLAILPLAWREARRAEAPLTRANWHTFLFVGVLMFAGMTAQQLGLLTTSVTNSGFLTGLYVVLTPILSVALFRQWPHWVVWPASFACVAGIFLLSGGRLDALVAGDWLTVAAAAVFALQVIFIGRAASGTGRPVTLAVVQFAVCAVLGLAVAFALEPVEWSAILPALPEILYAGVFSGGIAFTIQAVAQRYTTPAQAAIFLASEAVFAAIFAAIFLHERLPGIALVGCGLIFAGILAVEVVPALGPQRRQPQQNG